ncbi:hypothetical protein M404DRAFT_33908 [Pisolithus tinctorius Marx 270]|uniref:CCHC-type domain-containing protein n=1 Tax=Pisolithus tinctorius Marx 270 TaxID=870435 RepID=A0A0C3JDN7_PISTI|nr:hypothetical protein M404DRAFT_33908 [Pisolithus tinctorius Marx 270]
MVNTHSTACRGTRARASSLPQSPTTQPGTEIIGVSPLPKLTPLGSQYSTPIEKPAASNIRSYSDVVRSGSRSPSPVPQGATIDVPGLRTSSPVYPGDIGVPEASQARTVRVRVATHSTNNVLPDNVHCDSLSIFPMSDMEAEQNDWTEVVHKKSRERRAHSMLRPDQTNAVRRAEWQLTLDEREKIRRRSLSMTRDNPEVTSSESDEPSAKGECKGKGPNPRNWGNLKLSENEIDPDAQRAALASWNAANRLANESDGDQTRPSKGNDLEGTAQPTEDELLEPHGREDERIPKRSKLKHSKKNKKRVTKPSREPPNPIKEMKMPRAMEPVKQINPKSYIGLAFKRLEKDEKRSKRSKNKRKAKHTSDSSSDNTSSSKSASTTSESSNDDSISSNSSSDPSSYSGMSDDDSSSTTSESSLSLGGLSSGSSHRRGRSRRRKSGKGKKCKSKKHLKSHRRMTLKPIPPNKYDGSDDIHAFQRFITEGAVYVTDGRVEPKKCAFILSHYLTGKAHEFYVWEVSGDPYKWRLSDFFTQLFNYCFPIDFRMWQREKLQSCYQNSKTVRNYLYELNELWNMIGETDKCTKVHKFWSGLRKELQRDLWKEKLNLEVSSLKKISASAEILEIAQTVAESPEPHKSGHKRRRKRKRKFKGEGYRKEAAMPDNHNLGGKHTKRQDKRKRDTPKLSKEEQERHKAEGLCFICHKSGHFSRNCPDRQTVLNASKSSGVTSFGVGVDFRDIECQRQLASLSRHSPEVSLNFIQARGPTIQEDDGVPDDDLPDLESISDDEDYWTSDSTIPEEEAPNDGIHVYTYRSNQAHGIWEDKTTIDILDYHLAARLVLLLERISRSDFDVVHWHAKRLFRACVALMSSDPLEEEDLGICTLFKSAGNDETNGIADQLKDAPYDMIQLNGVKVRDEDKLTLQRNSSIAKDFTQKIPKPLVVIVHVNGHPARTLWDTTSG